MLQLLILIFSVHAMAGPVSVWTAGERKAYLNRHFIELEMLFIERGLKTDAVKIRAQAFDLEGCRSLHRGTGGASALVRCVRFIERERELPLTSPGIRALTEDINSLCRGLIGQEGVLRMIIKSSAFKGASSIWAPCLEASWEQVYLAAYAGFESDPVRVLALVRQAQSVLPSESVWKRKTLGLLR
jgi:hypothetical protein